MGGIVYDLNLGDRVTFPDGRWTTRYLKNAAKPRVWVREDTGETFAFPEDFFKLIVDDCGCLCPPGNARLLEKLEGTERIEHHYILNAESQRIRGGIVCGRRVKWLNTTPSMHLHPHVEEIAKRANPIKTYLIAINTRSIVQVPAELVTLVEAHNERRVPAHMLHGWFLVVGTLLDLLRRKCVKGAKLYGACELGDVIRKEMMDLGGCIPKE